MCVKFYNLMGLYQQFANWYENEFIDAFQDVFIIWLFNVTRWIFYFDSFLIPIGAAASLQILIRVDSDKALRVALSQAGFANDSDPGGLLPCWFGNFVRKRSSQKIAKCEKCPPGNYPMKNFKLDSSYITAICLVLHAWVFELMFFTVVIESVFSVTWSTG